MLIECTYGPVTTEVMGTSYHFTPDEFGRCVAEVYDRKHIEALTAVVHYRPVQKEPVQLTLTSLEPATAELGSADVTMVCTGTGFAPDSVIVFAGQLEPIVFMSTEQISTVVKPSLGWGAVSVPVLVRDYAGGETDELDFTFTEPLAEGAKRGRDEDDSNSRQKPKAKGR